MSQLLKLVSSLLMVLIVHQLKPIDADDYHRIVGGHTTTINRHKYIVSLRLRNGQFFCGGALVSKKHVVTAAHCMDGLKPRDFYVHGGVTYLSHIGIQRSVKKIIIAKTFSMQNATMDLAVLKLWLPMLGTNIAIIPLCSHAIFVDDWAEVSGWGLTSESATAPSTKLRRVNVRLISQEQCTMNYRNILKLSNTMMCASVPGEKDSCMGDSGGPLVHNGELCGIVSFGVGCANENHPGVYTIVSYFKKFIRNAMKEAEE